MENNIIWLLKMLLAHLTSDFLLQHSTWIADRNQNKYRSKYLYIHAAVTGITALVMVGYTYWVTVLVIAITHLLIDLWKSYTRTNFRNFLVDQAAHVIIIFLAWCILFHPMPTTEVLSKFYYNDRFWVYAIGFVFLTYPSAIIIDQATQKWSQQITNNNNAAAANAAAAANVANPTPANAAAAAAANAAVANAATGAATPAAGNAVTGLVNAGKFIGMMERLIICVLVIQNQYEAIGLLITGKSILRYNSSNEEIKTEYLLVGTLISMSLAFAVGMLFKYFQLINIL